MRHRAVTALTSAFDRREAWLWILALFAVSAIALRADGAAMADFFTALGSHNLVYWLCYAVIAQCIVSSVAAPVDRVTIATLFVGALSLAGIGVASMPALDGIVATGLGIVLYRQYADDPGLRRAGILFLALAVNLFWAQVAFALLKEQIVSLDAGLAEAMLRVAGYDVERTVNTVSAGAGFHISIIGACSAFNNLSLAVLAVVAAIIGLRGDLRRGDIVGVLIVCLVLVAFNTVRLSVFASSRGAYEFWHEGEGGAILGIVQTALTLAAAAAVAMLPRRRIAA